MKREQEVADVRLKIPQEMKPNVDMTQEKGASAWLTAIPREDYDFALHKATSGMYCTFDTNGHPLDCPHNVLVGRALVSHTP